MDYSQLFAQLAEECESVLRRRHEAYAELSRLASLIRTIVSMLRPQEQSRAEQLLERLENRPAGVTALVRLALANGEWQTTRQIRDFLVRAGWFAAYKSNPLASIQTTLRRLTPSTVEAKTSGGTSLYRLKRGGPLERARAGAAALQAIRDARPEPPIETVDATIRNVRGVRS